jgi:hypothetical protein
VSRKRLHAIKRFAKPLGVAEVRAFREHPLRDSLPSVFGHSGYLINPWRQHDGVDSEDTEAAMTWTLARLNQSGAREGEE